MEYQKPVKVSAIISCYRGEKYLPAFLENCAEQSLRSQLELVLIHNQPTENEQKLVDDFCKKHPGFVKHLVVPREPLAVSMNRAIKHSGGEYVCIWNIDDLRTPDSIEKMARTLDQHSQAGFTYGDFIIVTKWQSRKGMHIVSPEFDKLSFIQNMHLGPFYMWRKALCSRIGYFDEQFKSGADFDLAVRLAVESEGVKTHGLLGYYLNEGLGLSTGKTPWQPIERTMIELRYGVYHKLDFFYYFRARKYNLDNVLEDEKWRNLSELSPNLERFKESTIWLLYAAARYPFWLAFRAKNMIKKIYAKFL